MPDISDEARSVLEAAVIRSAHHGEAAEKLAEEVVELRKLLQRALDAVSFGFVRGGAVVEEEG